MKFFYLKIILGFLRESLEHHKRLALSPYKKTGKLTYLLHLVRNAIYPVSQFQNIKPTLAFSAQKRLTVQLQPIRYFLFFLVLVLCSLSQKSFFPSSPSSVLQMETVHFMKCQSFFVSLKLSSLSCLPMLFHFTSYIRILTVHILRKLCYSLRFNSQLTRWCKFSIVVCSISSVPIINQKFLCFIYMCNEFLWQLSYHELLCY